MTHDDWVTRSLEDSEYTLLQQWIDFFKVKSEHCDQRHLTPDTNGIVVEFLTEQLVAAKKEGYEKGLNDNRTDWNSGYQEGVKAMCNAASKLYEENKSKYHDPLDIFFDLDDIEQLADQLLNPQGEENGQQQ